MTEPRVERDPASYRDPSGFVFRRDGDLLRQINDSFASDWRAFHDSGLYGALRDARLIVAHQSVGRDAAAGPNAIDVIRPEPIPFLSFPYEWSFGQLRDAALLTLRAQEEALDRGMTLKDASAFNVQFIGARPILIDSLSFERADEGAPWVAYRQFCEHFLGPLALIAYRDPRLALLTRDLTDGIPVDLSAGLLPARSRLRFGLLSHLHMHAGAQKRALHSRTAAAPPGTVSDRRRMSRLQQRALLDSLRRAVEDLRWEPETTWSGYGHTTSYTAEAAAEKRQLVGELLDRMGGDWAWDIGANTGDFSEIAASGGRRVVAIDADPGAAELHYRRLRSTGSDAVLSIIGDLRAPSPALGWDLAERPSMFERANADVLLALALVHHVAIGGNVPLPSVTSTFARLSPRAIVEWVPKEDPQVVRMLAGRRDVFDGYSLDQFRSALREHFVIERELPIPGSARMLLALERHAAAP
jgi:precorrin-6B methylase 2